MISNQTLSKLTDGILDLDPAKHVVRVELDVDERLVLLEKITNKYSPRPFGCLPCPHVGFPALLTYAASLLVQEHYGEWLKENVSTHGRLLFRTLNSITFHDEEGRLFADIGFVDPSTAMLFKLTFGGA